MSGPDAGPDTGPDTGPDAGSGAGPDLGPDLGTNRGTNLVLSLGAVRATRDRIAPYVSTTPVVRSPDGVALKAESLHRAGSFKTRGAFNALVQLGAAQRSRGVVAHSSGNHAIAVADAAARLGVRAVIVMPHDAAATKLARTRTLGAEVHLVGSGSDERVEAAADLARRHGLQPVEPYDSPHVVEATATIGLELFEQVPDLQEVYVAISGGGLAAGVAAAVHLLAHEHGRPVRVVGVEPEIAADALASRRAGHIVTLPAEQMARTVADGLRVQQVGDLTWPYVERYVDDLVTVSEDAIRAAVRSTALDSRLVVEPSGAVPVAAATAGLGSTGSDPRTRVAIVGGGNIDPDLLASILLDERTDAAD